MTFADALKAVYGTWFDPRSTAAELERREREAKRELEDIDFEKRTFGTRPE